VRADLRSQAKAEAAFAEDLQIVSRVCQVQRTAWPRDRDVGHQFEVGLPRRDNQRKEHIVLAFEREDAVGPEVGDLARALTNRLRGSVHL